MINHDFQDVPLNAFNDFCKLLLSNNRMHKSFLDIMLKIVQFKRNDLAPYAL